MASPRLPVTTRRPVRKSCQTLGCTPAARAGCGIRKIISGTRPSSAVTTSIASAPCSGKNASANAPSGAAATVITPCNA